MQSKASQALGPSGTTSAPTCRWIAVTRVTATGHYVDGKTSKLHFQTQIIAKFFKSISRNYSIQLTTNIPITLFNPRSTFTYMSIPTLQVRKLDLRNSEKIVAEALCFTAGSDRGSYKPQPPAFQLRVFLYRPASHLFLFLTKLNSPLAASAYSI